MLQQPAGLIALQQVATQRTPTPCLQVVIYTQLLPFALYDKVVCLCAREVLTCAQTCVGTKPSKGFLLVPQLGKGLQAFHQAGVHERRLESYHLVFYERYNFVAVFCSGLVPGSLPVSDAARSFSIHNNNFVKNSKNFQIVSGR